MRGRPSNGAGSTGNILLPMQTSKIRYCSAITLTSTLDLPKSMKRKRDNTMQHDQTLTALSGGGRPCGVMYRRPAGGYYYRPSPHHRTIRLGKTLAVAREKMRRVRRGEVKLTRTIESPEGSPEALDAYRLKRLRRQVISSIRARSRGAPCLTYEDFDRLWARAGGRCELTGIPFSFDKQPHHWKRPFGPSVDRIDNARGYTPENCRLVCTAVNLALNEFGEDVLRKIAAALAHRP